MQQGTLTRRAFTAWVAAAGAGALIPAAAEAQQPILDAHIHLFDPRRPGGIPWPLPSDSIYAPALPDRYAKLAAPEGVRGAIVVEASPLLEDNDWVLRAAADQPIIVGFVGDLIPGATQFPQQLDRLSANPLFLGIRCGNLWQRDLAADVRSPAFMQGLTVLASHGLTLDAANPDLPLLAALVHVVEKIPTLRIVIDHLPSLAVPADAAQRAEYLDLLHGLASRPEVFVKLSEIPVQRDSRTVLDLGFYRAHLDTIWGAFGEDHILFGSDWPNSDHLATYAQTLRLARAYVAEKGSAALHKFLWSNARAAYRWKPRRADQALA